MAESNNYTPENDLNLEASLTQDDVYQPEDDLQLTQSLVSTPTFGITSAAAVATGQARTLTGGTATIQLSSALSNATGGTADLTGGTATLEPNTATSLGTGADNISLITASFSIITAQSQGSGVSNLSLTIPPIATTEAQAQAKGGEIGTDVIGTDGDVDVLIEGQKIAAYTNIELKKRLNEVDTFKFEAFIEDNDDRALIQEGNIVKFVEGYNDLLFKGVLNEVEYKSSFRAVCEGNGMEQKLLNRKTDRETFTNSSGDAIVKDVVPTSVISRGEIESAPEVSVRFDHDNLARAVAGVANATGYDWYVDQEKGDDFSEDFLNFEADAGSDTVQETYEIGKNARLVKRNKDEGFIANDITLLGRGDGINQLEANVFAASSAFTDTTEVVAETGVSSISVKDATDLGSVGDNLLVRLGTEVLDVNISDSSTLTVNDRGLNNFKGDKTEKIKHFKNVRVWRIENITQGLARFTPETRSTAENGSSIEQFGVREQRETDKTIVDISTLEKAADLELKNRFEDIFRVQVKPTEPRTTKKLDLGDKVDVTDLTAMDVDDTFQITGIDAQRASAGEGTTLHLANRPRRLTERLSEIESNTDTLNAHMQGATNFNGEHFEDNVDNTRPLTNKIFVPDDVVSINKFELTFAREPFRGYVENTTTESFETVQPISQSIQTSPISTTSLNENDSFTLSDKVDTEGFDTSHSYIFYKIDTSLASTTDDLEVRININGFTEYTETTNVGGNGEIENNLPTDLIDNGDDVELEVINRGVEFVDIETSTTLEVRSFIGHQHTLPEPNFGIFEPGSEPDIDVEVSVDGNLVTTIQNVSVGDEKSTPIKLADKLSEPLTGTYHQIELKPIDAGGGNNGRSRLTADITEKVFIESTL